ncbi:MAG TPA: DUF6675 family protein, partial [Treponemataceae bacterium]|nr:DUF6675 family protein [Treponemataceae bacterium]
YNHIPYFSESKQRWEILFNDAHIVNKKEIDNGFSLDINLKMDPFGAFDADVISKQFDNELVFFFTNPQKLRVLRIPIIPPGNMLCTVYAFLYEDNWIIYGTGGILAPNIPIFGKKAEVSFINRISTFCRYMISEIE